MAVKPPRRLRTIRQGRTMAGQGWYPRKGHEGFKALEIIANVAVGPGDDAAAPAEDRVAGENSVLAHEADRVGRVARGLQLLKIGRELAHDSTGHRHKPVNAINMIR